MKIGWHTEKRKLGDLKQLENNPRKISDKDYQKLGEDIEEMGNFRPLIIDTDNIILGGNQRYKQLLEKYGDDFEVAAPVSRWARSFSLVSGVVVLVSVGFLGVAGLAGVVGLVVGFGLLGVVVLS